VKTVVTRFGQMADGPPGGKKTTKRKGMKLGAANRHGDEESGNASFEKEPLIEKRQLGTEATWGDDVSFFHHSK
jgi:hypothetical protein